MLSSSLAALSSRASSLRLSTTTTTTTTTTAAAAAPLVPSRSLNLHEYQSKELLNAHGVNTQRWRLAESRDAAAAAAAELDAKLYVVKSQVHAGGRGQGTFDTGFKGGVHLTERRDEVATLAEKMLGNRLVTKQTTADGVLVKKLIVAEALDIESEFYVAILMDRESLGPVVVASRFGGMDIETVAEETPDAIFKEKVDIFTGITAEQCARVADNLGIDDAALRAKAAEQIGRLYSLFIATDCTMIEINPFATVRLADNKRDVYAVDAKLGFDDSAKFRQPAIFADADSSEEDPREAAAAEAGLNYVGMEGNIGCMVNGAGLAMSTMDIIKANGGEPANFMDAGGGANVAQITRAFEIITADARVRAVLVNVFGGIVKCDDIATGVITAAQSIGLKVPLVVRLEGTNAQKGYELLEKSGLKLETADDMDDAAKKVCAHVI